MTLQVTIIGLHQIGASIGLALKAKQNDILRIGNDKNPDYMRDAQRIGAIDKVMYNLPSATEKADIVVLAIPPDELAETIQVVTPCLKPGAVMIDTSPVKNPVTDMVKQYLEEERYFVSVTPTINPIYLNEITLGSKSAHPDLFKNSIMIITAPPGTHADALKLATDFSLLLDAIPFYADPYESDGLLAKMDLLPQLIAAAMLDSCVDQPGWSEARKVAGKHFFQLTNPILFMEEEKPLGKMALLNSDNTLRVIDNFMNSLMELRSLIADKDEEGLHNYLLNARDGRFKWWVHREKGDWNDTGEKVEIPGAGEMISQLFFGKLMKKRKGGEK